MQFVQLQCQRFLGITAFSAIYTTSCTWRSDFCCRHALLSACIFITTCVSSWQIGNQNIDFGFMPSRRMQAVSLLLMFDRLVRSKTGILPFRLDRHPNHDRPCLLYPQGMSPLSASICSHANQIHIGVPLRFCFDRSALRRSYCVVIFSDLRILTDVFAPPLRPDTDPNSLGLFFDNNNLLSQIRKQSSRRKRLCANRPAGFARILAIEIYLHVSPRCKNIKHLRPLY